MNWTVEPNCRICKTPTDPIHDFGDLALTSIFPSPTQTAVHIPMTVRHCPSCGLLQLGENTAPELMYREGYGYKSGINESMVKHLTDLVQQAAQCALPNCNVLDIGCNDGTLLKAWEPYGVKRFGMDPICIIPKDSPGITLIADYFKPYRLLNDDIKQSGMFPEKYKVITSIAMFYDLPDPVQFAKDIAESLLDDGVWIVEVGYAGAVRDGSWDTICHEHLTYFGLTQLATIANLAGLNIMHYSFSPSNGGSIRCMIGRGQGCDLRKMQDEYGWDWKSLGKTIRGSCAEIKEAVISQQKVYALGASTKGNTLLQASGLNNHLVTAAIERNPDKIGRRTPGTNIPIMSEDWAKANPPDAFLVLPYHFKDSILARYSEFRDQGVKFIFPLPELEIV